MFCSSHGGEMRMKKFYHTHDGVDSPDVADGSARILVGVDASKPTDEYISGRLYYATDTDRIYYDSGSAWVALDIEHGVLTGLSDDDHTQYLNNTRHDTTDRHTLGTVVPHDALASLTEKSHNSLTNVTTDQHHAKSHGIASSTDHTSAITSGKMIKADANGLPAEATNTDAEVAAACSANHPRLHDFSSPFDHSPPLANFDMNNKKFTNLAKPVNDNDSARLGDITREFFVPSAAPTTGLNRMDFRVDSIGGSGSSIMEFVVPWDFVSLVAIEVVYLSGYAGGAGKSIWLDSQYGKNGEMYNNHVESNHASTFTISVLDYWGIISVATVFTALEPGDRASFIFATKAIGGTIYILGLRIRYKGLA